MDQGSRIAVKRKIKIGRQNSDCFEVLEGLEAGEEVITSGDETFGDMEKVIFGEGGSEKPRKPE